MITLAIVMLNYSPELLAYAWKLACLEMISTMFLIRKLGR